MKRGSKHHWSTTLLFDARDVLKQGCEQGKFSESRCGCDDDGLGRASGGCLVGLDAQAKFCGFLLALGVMYDALAAVRPAALSLDLS
jgi:hypothetical protein